MEVSGAGSGAKSSGGSGGVSKSAGADKPQESKSVDTAPVAKDTPSPGEVEKDHAPDQTQTASLDKDPVDTERNPDKAESLMKEQADLAKGLTDDGSTFELAEAEETGADPATRGVDGAEEAPVVDAPPAEATPEITAEQQAKLDEYNEARALLDSYTTMTALDAPPEIQEKILAAEDVIAGYEDRYEETMSRLSDGFSEMDKEVARGASYLEGEGKLLSEEELERATEVIDARRAEANAPLEAATSDMVEMLKEPAFQAYLEDMDPEQKADFFEDMSKYMLATPEGREWIAGFSDGLAELGHEGQTSNAISEMAADYRSSLDAGSPELAALDGKLGAMVGLDLSQRPEGADARFQDIAAGLGMPQSDVEALQHLDGAKFEELSSFTQGVGFAKATYDQLWGENPVGSPIGDASTNLTYAGLGSDGMKALSALTAASETAGPILSKMGSVLKAGGALGKVLGPVGLAFSAGAVVEKWSQGESGAAELAGLAGGAALVAAEVVGSGGLALAGYALVGAGLILPGIMENMAQGRFDEEITRAALGQDGIDTLRGQAILNAPPGAVGNLSRLNPDMSPADSLNALLAERIGMPGDSFLAQVFWEQVQFDVDRTYPDPLLGPPMGN